MFIMDPTSYPAFLIIATIAAIAAVPIIKLQDFLCDKYPFYGKFNKKNEMFRKSVLVNPIKSFFFIWLFFIVVISIAYFAI